MVENRISLIILQHPQEVLEAKNSARLLHLCLKNSQLYVGEDFGDTFFENLTSPNYIDILLYPDAPKNTALGLSSLSKIDPLALDIDNNLSESRPVRLWVLDATWRKSRKMLYVNPALRALPRLSLQGCPPSMYKIRKAQNENQLSTLEASCYALQKLERGDVNYSPILEAFAAFVAQRQTFLPSSL
jgi:DTW domain-containing protein YfiP